MLSTLLVHSKESVLIDFPTITSLYFGCYMIKVDIMYYMILYIRVCTGMFCSGSGQSRKSTIRTQLLPVCIFRPDLSPLTVCFHNSRGFFFFFWSIICLLIPSPPSHTITHLPGNVNAFPNSGHYSLLTFWWATLYFYFLIYCFIAFCLLRQPWTII